MTTQFLSDPSLSSAHYAEFVAQQFAAVRPQETLHIALSDSIGLVLATDLRALHDIPSFVNSQMDGYALTKNSCGRSERIFRVGADIAAGSDTQDLIPEDDVAYPIMTGAKVPEGLAAVVPEENCEPLGEYDGHFAAQGSSIFIPVTDSGKFIRLPGEDIHQEDLLASAGTTVTPALIGALAAQGIKHVEVVDTPRVLVITGGDEIAANSSPQASQIRDSNGPMLAALLSQDGATCRRLNVTDEPHELVNTFKQEIRALKPHLIVSSGGISHGKYEVIKNAVELLREDADLPVIHHWFGHVEQQPGGPQGIISLQDNRENRKALWLALPGNPVSTLISYRLFLHPLLTTRTSASTALYGVLKSPEVLQGLENKTQFLRATASNQTNPDGSYTFHLYPDFNPGSHLLHRAATANALVEIEPHTTYTNGDILRWYPLSSIEHI